MLPAHTIVKLLVGALLLGVLASCAAAPNEEIWGTNTKGQRVQLDPAKVCWHTFGSIPDNVEVVADPAADRFVFRKLPDTDGNATAGTTGTTSNVISVPDDGSGSGSGSGCTCSCSTGHCSPALIGGSCVCVIQDGCTSCTKS